MMVATPTTPTRIVIRRCACVSARWSAISAMISVKTNKPTLKRTTLSRRSAVAMIRGVSWALATWIATSSDPNVNTRNESASVTTVWNIACAPSSARIGFQLSQSSRMRSNGMVASTTTMAMNGTTHNADLR